MTALDHAGQASSYVCLDKIALGGMAEVHLARREGQAGFRQLVALKRVLPQFADDPELLRLFLNEARLAATLEHSNIARIIDFGLLADRYFLAMEYVHGRDLRTVMHTAGRELPQGRLSLEQSLYIVQSVAAGLHYAHERCGPQGRPLGLVHRDVSPSNVLLSFDGEVKLGDFGIAKATSGTQATATATLRGKLAYMSPEQARSEALDRRSDIFALGIVLFELTTGMRHFVADTQYQLLNAVAEGRVTRPSEVVDDYPADLEAIVLRAMAPTVEDRYATALELFEDLGVFAKGHGLRLDAAPQLGRTLRQLFGDASYPDVDESGNATVELGTPVHVVASDPPLPPPRRIPWPLIAVLGVGVALGVAISQTVATPEPEAEPDPPRSAEASAPNPEPTPVAAAPSDVPDAAPAPEPEPEPEPEVAAPSPEPVAADSPEPVAADSPKPRKRPRRTHRRPKPDSDPAPEPKPSKPTRSLDDWALPD